MTDKKKKNQKHKKKKKKRFGAEAVRPTLLSEIFGYFGDFENFVNVIGKDCGEVRP